jgi:hypothetical protein
LVGLATGYDSNVFASPFGIPPVDSGTKKASLSETLQLGLGYASSAAKTTQVVPSYRGTMNYNANAEARAGQFITHDLSVYLNFDPLAAIAFGLKVEGAWNLAYSDDTQRYSSYSLGGSVGPYLRRRIAAGWALGIDAFFEPQKIYADAVESPDNQRSGWAGTARLGFDSTETTGVWVPHLAVVGSYDHTSGSSFRSKNFTLELADTIFPSSSSSITLSASLGVSTYDSRPGPVRTDKLVSIGLTAIQQLGQGFQLLGTLGYTKNDSNIADYLYSRTVGSFAVMYLF